jgi:hypothetical protein
MNVSPLASIAGDAAASVGLPSIHNFASFDSLPLVEFVPHKQLNPKRVQELIRLDPHDDPKRKAPAQKKQNNRGGVSEWNND